MAIINVSPTQVLTADDATDLAALKVKLDEVGYTVGVTAKGTRVDDDANLKITISYPDWNWDI